jgi:hypothetical protein
MLTLTVVRLLPFVNGILKTPLSFLIFFPTYHFFFTLYTITNLSLIFSLQLGITLWKGMLQKQPYSACFFYIMYIDVIHNLMHNAHMAVSYYTHNG